MKVDRKHAGQQKVKILLLP